MAKALEVNENSAEDGDKEAARSPRRESDDKRKEKPTGKALQVNESSVDNEDDGSAASTGGRGEA
jgi:hypothetical protein